MKKQKVRSCINLDTLAGGAFAEKLNEALVQVAENIQNPNTDAAAKRGITVEMKFAPNKTRQFVSTIITVKTKLATTEAIDTEMVMGVNMRTGEVEIAEYDGQVRGQIPLEDPGEPETPAEAPAPAAEQPSGKPLDLRNRNKKQEAEPVPGLDYDPETGEVYEPAGQVVEFGKKTAQA